MLMNGRIRSQQGGTVLPEENPVHYCYGCQSCFAEMIDLDDIELDEMDCE